MRVAVAVGLGGAVVRVAVAVGGTAVRVVVGVGLPELAVNLSTQSSLLAYTEAGTVHTPLDGLMGLPPLRVV